MADDVFITGVAENALEAAFGDLPAWATEKTTELIYQELKSSLGDQTALLQKILKASEECCSKSGSDSDKLGKILEPFAKATKESAEQTKKDNKKAKDQSKEDDQTLLKTKKFSGTLERLGFVVSGLAAIGSKVLDVDKAYLSVYDSLYQSGVNVLSGYDHTKNGLEVLNGVVGQTGLRLETIQKIVEKFGTSVNAVGFKKFTSSMVAARTALDNLGYTAEAQGELIGTLIESEMGYSDVRSKTSQQIADDAAKLGAQVNKLSQTYGIAREQVLENMKANSKSTDSTIVAAVHGVDAAKNVNNILSGIKDPKIADALLKMASAADPVFTQVYKDLNDAGMGPLAAQLAEFAKKMRSSTDAVSSLDELETIAKTTAQQSINGIQYQIAAMNPAAQAAAEMAAGLTQFSRTSSQASEVQKDAATNTQAAVAKVYTELESFASKLQASTYPTLQQLDLFSSTLKTVNKTIQDFIDSVSGETRSWIAHAALIGTAIVGVATVLGGIGTAFNLIAPAVTSVGASIASIGVAVTAFSVAAAAAGGILAGLGATWLLEKSEGGRQFLDDVGGTINEILANFGNKEAIETRDRVDRQRLESVIGPTTKGGSSVTIPKSPAPSTIKSPSAAQPLPKSAEQNATDAVELSRISREASEAVPVSSNMAINSSLGTQTYILEQLAMSTKELLSVNKEILRFTKNAA